MLAKKEMREKIKVLCFKINFQFKKIITNKNEFLNVPGSMGIRSFIPGPAVSRSRFQSSVPFPQETRGKNIPCPTYSPGLSKMWNVLAKRNILWL